MLSMLKLLNLFSGPIGSLVEKAILAGVTYLFASGNISGDAAAVAASLYAAFSAIFSALNGTQTSKIAAINDTASNGVVVVQAAAARRSSISPADGPMPSTFGG